MNSSSTALLLKKLDRTRLPKHVAIIMDGNGRWAQRHNFGRIRGHRAGIKAIRHTTSIAAKLAIECVTLYAFSTENWNRPPKEVNALWSLLKEYLDKEIPKLAKKNVRLESIGRTDALPESVKKKLKWAKKLTEKSTGLKLVLALNYGARQEILDALNQCIKNNKNLSEISEADFAGCLYTNKYPEPDMLIRTSGEKRLSNFLLWQLSYAELIFLDVLWPDFNQEYFIHALIEFQNRDRRYGGLDHV